MSCPRLALAILGVVVLSVGSATILSLIYLRSHSRDEQKVILANNHADTPGDVYDLKNFFHDMYTVLFWTLVVYGSGLVVAGVFGAVAGCTKSKVVSHLLFSVLTLLIIAEVTASVLTIIFKRFILERLRAYVTLSFRYNLPDIGFIREKFNCCGDGTANMWNYECQGSGQINCSELLDNGMATFVVGTIVISVLLIAIQLIIAYLSASGSISRRETMINLSNIPKDSNMNQYVVPN